MARTPKPWYWEARKGWYVTIGGERHPLGDDEAKARKAFHRLMGADGQADAGRRKKLTAADAAEAMLASVQHHRLSTRQNYDYNLEPFAARFAARRLESIRHEEVIAFVAGYGGRHYRKHTFGPASRFLMFRYIKSLFKWAKETGLIETNPMHGKTCPWKIMARERVMTQQEYDTFQGSGASPKLKEVAEYLWRTGARPGEIAACRARHLDAHRSIIRLQPTEHKTGTKTGLQREIYVPDDLMARLRAYAVERPKLPLLTRQNGKPWTQRRISDMWGYWRGRIGLPDDCVIYLARHAFGTRAIDAGHTIAMVAKMLGHNDTGTLMTHYFHPDQVGMADAVNKLGAPRTDPDA